MEKGTYQMSFRGLSLAEAWRFSREPLKFAIALILKLLGTRGIKVWMPPHEAEESCEESDLTDQARAHLLPLLMEASQLGYNRTVFRRMTKNFDPNALEVFAFVTLHADGRRSLFVGYQRSKVGDKEKVCLSTTGAVRTNQGVDAVFANHNNYMDSGGVSRITRVKGSRIAEVDQAMTGYIAKHEFDIVPFANLDEMLRYSVDRDLIAAESRVARGLFVKVE